MVIREVTSEDGVDTVRFSWDHGSTGTMSLRFEGSQVIELDIAFDPLKAGPGTSSSL